MQFYESHRVEWLLTRSFQLPCNGKYVCHVVYVACALCLEHFQIGIVLPSPCDSLSGLCVCATVHNFKDKTCSLIGISHVSVRCYYPLLLLSPVKHHAHNSHLLDRSSIRWFTAHTKCQQTTNSSIRI